VLDLKTKAVSTLPNSKGMFCPPWSPDGRFIAAMPLDQQSLMLFDRSAQKWSQIADRAINNPRWSRDGQSIYFHAFQEVDQPIYGLSIQGCEAGADHRHPHLGAADHADFWSLGPSDALIASLRFWTADVYQLSWDPARHAGR
jgi:dipeptidyl aminopeptidase/acylaminoacyl peptidase